MRVRRSATRLNSALRALGAALILGFSPISSLAAWPENGTPVCTAPGTQRNPRLLSDGSGGCYLTWTDYRSGDGDVYVQRITATGEVAPGWPINGLPICTAAYEQDDPRITSDGSGGAIVAWFDNRESGVLGNGDIYATRVGFNATTAAGWPADGIRVSGSPTQRCILPRITSDGQGGAFIVWRDERNILGGTSTDIYMQRITGTGAIHDAWPIDGCQISIGIGGDDNPRVASDGRGGAYVAWGEYFRSGSPTVRFFAQRVDSLGHVAFGWPAWGIDMSGWIPDYSYSSMIELDASDDGAAIAAWEQYFLGLSQIYSQKVDSDGRTLWGIGVVKGNCKNHRLVRDGQGGALLAWWSYMGSVESVVAQRVDGNGNLQWTPDGISLHSSLSSTRYPEIAPTPSGGLIACWLDTRSALSTGWDVFGSQVSPAGALEPAWEPGGTPVCSAVGDQWVQSVVADGNAGAFVAWHDPRGVDADIYVQRIAADFPVPVLPQLARFDARPDRVWLVWDGVGADRLAGTIFRRSTDSGWMRIGEAEPDGRDRLQFTDLDVSPGVAYAYVLRFLWNGQEQATTETWVQVPGTPALELGGFAPNPARGAPIVQLELPSLAQGMLSLFDVTGREVTRIDLSRFGAGRYALRLEDTERLRNGVFLLRLAHSGKVQTRRAVLLR